MVPNAVMRGRTDCDFITLMIEMNRAAIFDENGKVLSSRMDLIRGITDRLVELSQDM